MPNVSKRTLADAQVRTQQAADAYWKRQEQLIDLQAQEILDKNPQYAKLREQDRVMRDKLHSNRILKKRKEFSIRVLKKKIKDKVLERDLTKVEKEDQRLQQQILTMVAEHTKLRQEIEQLSQHARMQAANTAEPNAHANVHTGQPITIN
jgi:predicted  nucleic acid-binding Zn-ribbon protein